ncbi:MAG: hypothetical protein HOQ09_08950 [Gemmatimonadaceae bacterium]|nr:hypothetical protein [Gemmatimonadaceae bacterium]
MAAGRGVRHAAAAGLLSVLLLTGGCFRAHPLPALPPEVVRAGLTQDDYALRQSFADGRFDDALSLVSPKGRFVPGDELLASLYRASALYYAGRFDTSGLALDRAAVLADDRYTKSISRNLLAAVTSDGTLPYEPSQTERLMMNYYGMLDFLRRGDVGGAAVEARRISALFESFDSRKDSVDVRTRALLNYLAGATFEAAGEKNDAAVSYRVARALVGDSALPFPAEPKKQRRSRGGARPPAADSTTGEVIVVIEHGYVAHRVPRLVLIPVTEDEFDKFGGKPEETLAAAAAISARTLVWIATDQDRFLWHDEDDDRELRMDDRSSQAAYLLPVAWTSLQRPYHPAWRGAVVVDSMVRRSFGVNADLCDAMANDFRRSRAAAIMRGVVRAGAKLALAEAAARKLEKKKGEFAGSVARWATDAINVATERADIRQWRLLPGELSIVRLSLPAGPHELSLDYAPGDGAATRRIALGTVDIRPGRIAFATTRLWDDGVLAPRRRVVVSGR